MLILTIRTDKPKAEIGLYQDNKRLGYLSWIAHHELSNTIHKKLQDLLQEKKKVLGDLKGIIAYKGPGSFTGLRIGLTVADALAYGFEIPIVASSRTEWIQSGLERLQRGENEISVLPEYGAEVHITLPRK